MQGAGALTLLLIIVRSRLSCWPAATPRTSDRFSPASEAMVLAWRWDDVQLGLELLCQAGQRRATPSYH